MKPSFSGWVWGSILVLACLSASIGHAQYKPAIDYDDLVAEYGGSLENGTGINVLQVEAPLGVNYMPNTGHAEFVGKTFTNGTAPPVAGASSHATSVGRHLYGNATSIAPGLTSITGVRADDFTNNDLGIVSGGEPTVQGYHVSNHSYVGSFPNAASKINALRRFDYVINRDNTVAVVGIENGASDTAYDAWAHSYNAISVGRSDGLHWYGQTTDYGAGRSTPNIVVPMQGTGFNFSSYATPVVAGSAAILKQAAGFDGFGNSLNGGQNEAVKAMLFAGATKDESPGWAKTTTRPVDDVFGFGELNIYNSYKIQEGGEYAAFLNLDPPTANLGSRGWDFGSYNNGLLHYNFEVGAGQQITELSAALTWNVDVFDTNPNPLVFSPNHQLANMNLELFDSTGTFLGSVIQQSLSTVYNFEHIYLSTPLNAGEYTFRLSSDIPVEYGFAWRMTVVPEPSSLGLILIATCGLAMRRRR